MRISAPPPNLTVTPPRPATPKTPPRRPPKPPSVTSPPSSVTSPTRAPHPRTHRVLVIGAGMAGMSAASHLVASGVEDVMVLEARDRLGGRVFTKTVGGRPLELGAQWIWGGCPANSLFNLANRYEYIFCAVRVRIVIYRAHYNNEVFFRCS